MDNRCRKNHPWNDPTLNNLVVDNQTRDNQVFVNLLSEIIRLEMIMLRIFIPFAMDENNAMDF